MVFKRKQIIILALILVIVVAGYLQYSYRHGSTSADLDGLGEAVYVDSEIDNEDYANSDAALQGDESDQSNVTASQEAENYFAQARMNKEQSLSECTETFKAITEDVNASAEVKEEAYDKMIAMTTNADKETKIETLINKMGFDESLVIFADNGSIDVVVKTPSLTTAQVAQITDIVTRHADASVDDIHIRKLY
jgi:stage III sporulation protein AH